MWTDPEIQAASDAFKKAIAAVNVTAQLPFLANRENFLKLVNYMKAEQVDAAGYFYEKVWTSAIISCASDLETEAPQMSAADIARLREARDRKDGHTFRDDSAPTTRQSFKEAVKRQSEAANGFLNREQAKKQFEERRQIPGADASREQLKSLNSTELKIWLSKYGRTIAGPSQA